MKTLVLGLAAFTPELAFPWASDDVLPEMGRMLAEGVWGQLEADPAANRAAAWSSFATGFDPGKHGIFHADTPSPCPGLSLNARQRHGETFWKRLSDVGCRVGVVNVPMTYPAEVVEGYIITGTEAPSPRAPGFSYPRDFHRDITRGFSHAWCKEAEVYRDAARGQWQKAAQRISDCLETQCESILAASNAEPTVLLVAVLTAAETAQRLFWRNLDPCAPEPASPQDDNPAGLIQRVYRQLDQALAKLVQEISPEVVIVVSGHGMGPNQRGGEYLFEWLSSVGLLNTLPARTGSSQWSSRLRTSPRGAVSGRYPDRGLASMLAQIDWTESKAYCIGTDSIFVNLRRREPQGIVSEEAYDDLCQDIAGLLQTTIDPSTGSPAVDIVKMGRDIYDGPFAHRAPDIVIQWRKDCVLGGLETPGYRPVSSKGPTLIAGTSRPHGIFIAAGSGIRRGAQIHGARIADLAPTILHLSGAAVPDHLDGQVLTDIFEHEWMALHPILVEKQVRKNGPWKPTQADDAKLVEERLRGLGYIE